MTSKLYQILSAAFCVIVVISNIISAKMVKLPFFEDFFIPAGLITYPLTFLLSDLVTEIYGAKKAKEMVYIAFGMCLLSFGLIQIALVFPPAHSEFETIMGLSGLRIFSSLTAYIIAQIIGIQLFAWIRRWTGPQHLWLRNNGATWASQLVDTVAIDILFLYMGLKMPMAEVLPIMLFSYLYKAFFSVANTPLLYLGVYLIRRKEWQSTQSSPAAVSGVSNMTLPNAKE